jgi:hypothetical protein
MTVKNEFGDETNVKYTPTKDMINFGKNARNHQNFIPIGAMEVYFMGILIYSKVKCKLWPKVNTLVYKCHQAYAAYCNGENIETLKYSAHKKKTMGSINASSLTLKDYQSLNILNYNGSLGSIK